MREARMLEEYADERGYRTIFWNGGICPWCGTPEDRNIYLVQQLDPHLHSVMQPTRCAECTWDWLDATARYNALSGG